MLGRLLEPQEGIGAPAIPNSARSCILLVRICTSRGNSGVLPSGRTVVCSDCAAPQPQQRPNPKRSSCLLLPKTPTLTLTLLLSRFMWEGRCSQAMQG